MEKAEIDEGDKIRLIEKAESECSHVSRDAQAWPWTFCSSVWRSNASFAHRTFRQVCVEGYVMCVRCARWSGLIARHAGPFFVSFPNIREALTNNVAIKTQARSCTILPHFVGYAS